MINATECERRSRESARIFYKRYAVKLHITCCENDRLDALLSGKIFHIKEGIATWNE